MPRNKRQLMLKGVNGVPLNLRERQAMVRELATQHQHASKRGRGQLLDQLQALTGYNRSCAARVLRRADNRRTPRGRRSRSGRKRHYDDVVLGVLRRIWAILDFPDGKRLAPFLPEIVPSYREIDVLPEIRTKLLTISAATIDRLLASERKRLQLKGRSGTNA